MGEPILKTNFIKPDIKINAIDNQYKINEILTWANLITTMRLVSIPFIIYYSFTTSYYSEIVIAVIISQLSDKLDGWVAKFFSQSYTFGKKFDANADKIGNAVLDFYLVFMSVFFLPLVIILTFLQIYLFYIANYKKPRLLKLGKKLTTGANNYGKIKTVIQGLAIVLGFFYLGGLVDKYITWYLINTIYLIAIPYAILSIINHLKEE